MDAGAADSGCLGHGSGPRSAVLRGGLRRPRRGRRHDGARPAGVEAALMSDAAVRALFVDIGGVLATNGWDTDSREASVEHFELDARAIDSRHRLMFELFETGKVSWKQYLDRVVFNVPRPFTFDEFTRFVFAHSRPYPDMIELVR